MNFLKRLPCAGAAEDVAAHSPYAETSGSNPGATTSMARQWEGLPRRPTSLLHETVPPRRLGVPPFQHAVVEVSSTTLVNLEYASRTVRLVRDMLPAAGNQKPEMVLTQGESAVRHAYAREQARLGRAERGAAGGSVDRSGLLDRYALDADLATQARAGNCGQYAGLSWRALAAHTLDAPVQRVRDEREDHEYVLIGDPRDRRYGDRDTVVVDAWVGHPVAHTLAQSIEARPALTGIVRSVGQAPTPEEIAAFEKELPVVSTWEVNQHLAQQGEPPVGKALLKSLYATKPRESLFDTRTAVKDPSTRYTDGTAPARSFDQIDAALVKRQESAARAFDRFVQRHPQWKDDQP